ncbi:aspartate aminotransferase family protein [Kribbella solani]|uniref:Glutamate-1-semialdehyde 2,1-aminomutase n=1 Tax=Kribbella solani TaxID=236067 RepID=A0A841DY69_9ACTN|nr:aspartate aminotransferase family protein [Kribbella solani]MBB5982901.1 glutamate-1-semialdehyde 2,1-aminomutase [Kribbella solani]MDX2973351.1 aspartate aminotransferase family protein [Kribbella solani]
MTTEQLRLDVGSEGLRARALVRAPGGVHSNVRLRGPHPFIRSAKGAWLFGVDGRDYVDYLLGQGPNFLGHAPDAVVQAVSAACEGGLLYGGQHELEVQAAELVCEVAGWPEMVRFSTSGTEAVQAALRVARAATGRTEIVRFQGHYHGWVDNILVGERGGDWGVASDGQVADNLRPCHILPWNDAELLTAQFEQYGSRLAAVIMEPIMINTGVIEPKPGYLETVRELCNRYGVVLIFDEVISGFRVGLGGAAQRYGVTPDLATYGKAFAGGYPVAALVGRSDLMSQLSTGAVNHSGTFNASVMAMAAVTATLTTLRDRPPYASVEEHGLALMAGLRDIAAKHDVQLRVAGLPAAFHMSFGDADVTDYRSLQKLDLARYERLAAALVDNGIWLAGRGIWYVSGAHGPRELDVALTRFDKTLGEWALKVER